MAGRVNIAQAVIQTDRGPQIDPEIAYRATPVDPEQIRALLADMDRRTDSTMAGIRRHAGVWAAG